MKKLIGLCALAAAMVAGLEAQDITGTIEGSVSMPGSRRTNARVTIIIPTATKWSAPAHGFERQLLGGSDSGRNVPIKVEVKGFKIVKPHGRRIERQRRSQDQLLMEVEASAIGESSRGSGYRAVDWRRRPIDHHSGLQVQRVRPRACTAIIADASGICVMPGLRRARTHEL